MKTILRMIYLLLIMTSVGCSQFNYHSINSSPASSQLTAGSYPTAMVAAIAATNRYNPPSIAEDREYMGAVLRNGDQYHYTVAAGEVGSDRISVKLAIPAGMEVVAFWHTHGAAYFSRRYFSDTDSALVQQWHKPFYMADATGILRVLEPGHGRLSALRAQRLGLGRRSGYAEGKEVLAAAGDRVRVAIGS